MFKMQWSVIGQNQPASLQQVVDLLLQNRNAGPSFLNGSLKDLEPHLAMTDLASGAEITAQHVSSGHKVVLVGDYDCDGITSVAQVALFLRAIGHERFAVVIPQRAEGYGIPARVVAEHADARLFLIMDCGTTQGDTIGRLRALGADCVVIDHHAVAHSARVAPASALINPKQPGCASLFKDFCSSTLTLLFLARLRRALAPRFVSGCLPALGGKYLSLATLATVADLVPLVDGNRIITRAGLAHLNGCRTPPFRQIVEVSGLAGKTITAGRVAFALAPRINAAGRVGDPTHAYELLVSEDEGTARRLAEELSRFNARRQELERVILEEVRRRLPVDLEGRRALVLGDPHWVPGLLGIVASRVQQQFLFAPVILCAIDEGQGVARGSARSIPGFDLITALERCGAHVLQWGGHPMAAGVTLAVDQLEPFAACFEHVAREQSADLFARRGLVDAFLGLDMVSEELIAAIQPFEPHGLGNPAPVFAARGVRIAVQRPFGHDQAHLRLLLDDAMPATFWNGVHHAQQIGWQDGDHLDVVYQLEWDAYRQRPALLVKDVGSIF